MLRTLIIYDSKYGSTKDAARILSLVLGPSRACRVSDFKESYRDFDLFVLGAPVFKGVMSPDLWNFVRTSKPWLCDKEIATFCTCIDQDDGLAVLSQLEKMIGKQPIVSRPIGGRMQVEKLDSKDLAGMESFCKRKGYEFQDIDLFSKSDIVNMALEIKTARDSLIPAMPSKDLKILIEIFLAAHNTCTLATCSDGRVRATPIEYSYHDDCLYMLSEGGEKFANIILNDSVSVAVYDEYRSMADLAGMQISGKATLVGREDPQYHRILKQKGIRPKLISSLQIELNLVKVEIEKVEVLDAKLKSKGYEITQTYIF